MSESEPMWPIEARNAAIANSFFTAAINRVGTVSNNVMCPAKQISRVCSFVAIIRNILNTSSPQEMESQVSLHHVVYCTFM